VKPPSGSDRAVRWSGRLAAPTRELEKLIVSKKLAHGGNSVTRWMAANVAVAQEEPQPSSQPFWV
jgi:phage terminase large subunit-like protein